MTGTRMIRSAALAAALAGFVPGAARALTSDSIIVQVGGAVSSGIYNVVDVPVSIDMRGAPGRSLGGYRLTLRYDPGVLNYCSYCGVPGGNFADPLINSDSSGYGVLRYTALLPAGATGNIQVFTTHFYVYADTAPSAITVTVEDLTASAGSITPFEDLLPLVRIVNGTFCQLAGKWGDLDGDGSVGSRDALLTLSAVVGQALDTTQIHTTLADVDNDGRVTSRDALIILSYAVGLDVTGFRIGLPSAGACAVGSATTLVALPDSLELQKGQLVQVVLRATDANGRIVPTGPITWTSSNSAVAAYIGNNYGDAPPANRGPSATTMTYGLGVEARDPGVAILTAELAPGIRAQLKVVVIGRRRNWYANASARNAVTQTGSQQYPFAAIGDAMDEQLVFDGDTIHVASGNYDERISSYVSVVLLGDSINRPVVDDRGDPYYYSYYDAIAVGSPGGRMEIAHLIVRGGGIYIEGHDNVVRDVTVDMLGGTGTGIQVYSQASVPYPGGPARAPEPDLGFVDVHDVTVRGFPYTGIEIDQADSVLIHHATVVGDSVKEYCYVNSGSNSGISIDEANRAVVRDNDISYTRCAGIVGVLADGRFEAYRNHVSHVGSVGIMSGAKVVMFGGNRVWDIGSDSAYYYYGVIGLYASNGWNAQDTMRSTADTVSDVRGQYPTGIYVDQAVNAAIDAARIDSIGLNPGVYTGSGIIAYADWYTQAHSRISHTGTYGFYSDTPRHAIGMRENVYRDIGQNAVAISMSCECSGSIDSVMISADSASYTGSNAIELSDVTIARVDTVVLDSVGGDAVRLVGVGRGVVRGSKLSRATGTGVWVYYGGSVEARGNAMAHLDGDGVYADGMSDSVRMVGNSVDSSSSNGTLAAFESYNSHNVRVDSNAVLANGGFGVFLDQITGSAIVAANAIDSTGQQGVALYTTTAATSVTGNVISRSGHEGISVENMTDTVLIAGNAVDLGLADGIITVASPIRADSNVVTNSGMSGIAFYNGGGGIATRNRLQNNAWYGISIDASDMTTYPVARLNTIQGNVKGGAANYSAPTAIMDADTNYWGDSRGPRCDSVVTGVACNPASLGDSVETGGITFAGFLAAAAPGAPSPPALRSIAARPRVASGTVRLARAPAPTIDRAAILQAVQRQRADGAAEALRRRQTLAGTIRAPSAEPRARHGFPPAWQRGRGPRQPAPRTNR